MAIYKLKFWFEHGGGCLWSVNDAAREKYGYYIDTKSLPLSKSTQDKINDLELVYGTFLDWDNPQEPSKWPEEQKLDFIKKSTELYHILSDELGQDYEISNNVGSCV